MLVMNQGELQRFIIISQLITNLGINTSKYVQVFTWNTLRIAERD
jgi:hypothetical protein